MADTDLELKVGDEDESPATIAIDEEGNTELLDGKSQEVPVVETPEASAQAPEGGELDDYSDKVKKRIDKLTARLRETERREQAALEYARSVQQKAQALEQQAAQSDNARLDEAKNRIETQTVALKQIIRKAREEGDYDTEIEAQERLTEILVEQRAMQEAASRRPVAEPVQRQVVQPASVPQQPQQPIYDPKAEAWAEENEWYGRDVAMTHAAQGIHRQLVLVEKFDPTSDEYYDELNSRLKEAFPTKLQPSSTQTNRTNRPVQTVAPAARSSGVNNARRTVKLSTSQVAIAKKLGVPLEEYAKYVKE